MLMDKPDRVIQKLCENCRFSDINKGINSINIWEAATIHEAQHYETRNLGAGYMIISVLGDGYHT